MGLIFLYLILVVITAITHCVVLLILFLLQGLEFSKPIEKQLKLKLRSAGVESSTSFQGDLSQMKKPEKVVKSDKARKQLQTSKKTLFKVNFARKIQPVSPSKKKTQSKPVKKAQNQPKKSPPPLDLSDLGYKQETSLPAVEYRQNDIASYAEQQRILETITGQPATVDLSQVSSSVQIEVPNGVPLDQLNTVER